MKAILINEDSTVETFDMAEGGHERMVQFQEKVGGYFTFVAQNFNSQACMIVNEDPVGEFNVLATFLSGLYPHDSLYGPAIITGAVDEQGDEQGVPPELIEAVKAIDVETTWAKYRRAVGG